MEYQMLNKKFVFNEKRSIGSVLYIVEGEKREINLLGHIFKEILGYEEVTGIDRIGRERVSYRSKQNSNSKIFIINSKSSNIQSIRNRQFIDDMVKILRNYDEDFSYEDIPIYYLFDCDRDKDQEAIKELIAEYTNAREPSKNNEFNSIGGMLLLSYPAIETFVISNFEKDMFKFNERFKFKEQSPQKNHLKKYIGDNKYDNHKMSLNTLTNAFKELVTSLETINIDKVNLDDTQEFNNDIYKYEQLHNNQYMLSLLLISFIDLGIIEFEE